MHVDNALCYMLSVVWERPLTPMHLTHGRGLDASGLIVWNEAENLMKHHAIGYMHVCATLYARVISECPDWWWAEMGYLTYVKKTHLEHDLRQWTSVFGFEETKMTRKDIL